MEVVIDFETWNPVCDLTTVGSRVYAEHWATEILCVCFNLCGRSLIWAPALDPWDEISRELVDLASSPSAIFIAHNAGFEKDIWREIMVPRYGFPDIPNGRWHDTMAVCAMKAIPLGLERVLPILGLGEKDKAGSKLTLGLSKLVKPTKKNGFTEPQLPARTPEVMECVYDYCGHDVADENALHQRLGWLPDSERRVWLLDQRINERGVRLDDRFLAGAERIVDAARQPLVDEFRSLTGCEPTQVAKVCEWLRRQGVDLPDVRKETIAKLLGDKDADEGRAWDRQECNLDTLSRDARRALAIRSLVGGSSVKKLSRMAGCISRDGRAYRLLQYHGTGPGRWAGRLFNPLNFPRGITRTADQKPHDPAAVAHALSTGDIAAVDALGLVVEDQPGHWRPANGIEVVASALRHAIIPDPGHCLVVGDFTQIQARMVLALAGQHDKTALMASGRDVYCDMASAIYGMPVTKADVEKRQIGKNTVLGCGFQMGPAKFHAKYCQDQPLEFAEQVIHAYRQTWAPKVPQLWKALEQAALRTVQTGAPHEAFGIEYRIEDSWLSARLPDDKKIWYFNPQPAQKVLPWSDWPTDCWTYQATKAGQWTTIYAFGGLLTENVVMGLERQLLARAMQRCEDEGLRPILNSYDEIICEPPSWMADWEILKQIMEDPPEWAKAIKLPIAAEGWIGTRYKKG